MYEVLKKYTFDDAIGFTFCKKVIFNYETEEIYFCLTVQNSDWGTDENILLDFVDDADDFEEKAQAVVREYLLNDIADSVECVACDLNIEDSIKINVNHVDCVITINGESFKLFNEKLSIDDYEQLESDVIHYVQSLGERTK